MTRGAEAAVRVLGVDPGTAVTGWGIVERRDGRVTHLAHGAVKIGRAACRERV